MNKATSENCFHGGDIISASQHYDIPMDQWIDLSTGINPEPYPVTDTLGDMSAQAFERLPYLQPDFLDSAGAYYFDQDYEKTDDHRRRLLAVPGSQSVIQALPACLAKLPVILPELGYQEHVQAWRDSDADLAFYDALELSTAKDQIDSLIAHKSAHHLVVINPNNPSGLQFSIQQLNIWAQSLSGGGHLIVDEAFIDTQPENSLLAQAPINNLVVLRSFGKFFGLAGLRLGFAFANENLCAQLQQRIGPWSINGPAQEIATHAFQNTAWQQQASINIVTSGKASSALFAPLFAQYAVIRSMHQPLFTSYWLEAELAAFIYRAFAMRGILLRQIDCQQTGLSILRIGSLNFEDEDAVARVKETIQVLIDVGLFQEK